MSKYYKSREEPGEKVWLHKMVKLVKCNIRGGNVGTCELRNIERQLIEEVDLSGPMDKVEFHNMPSVWVGGEYDNATGMFFDDNLGRCILYQDPGVLKKTMVCSAYVRPIPREATVGSLLSRKYD